MGMGMRRPGPDKITGHCVPSSWKLARTWTQQDVEAGQLLEEGRGGARSEEKSREESSYEDRSTLPPHSFTDLPRT
eukprot:4453537-Pyramimonas_sp.AAC.1